MKMLLNGEWVERAARMEVRDPQDDSLVDTVPQANAADMDAAIAAAVCGFERTRRLSVHERRAILTRAADLVAARREPGQTVHCSTHRVGPLASRHPLVTINLISIVLSSG